VLQLLFTINQKFCEEKKWFASTQIMMKPLHLKEDFSITVSQPSPTK